jgi:hypothetical protein
MDRYAFGEAADLMFGPSIYRANRTRNSSAGLWKVLLYFFIALK